MTGSFQESKNDFSELNLVLILNGFVRKCGAGFFAEDNFRPSASREFPMTADKIGVKMRFNYVLDLESVCLSFIDILIDIALRIDHCGFAFLSDQIRSVSKTAKIKLFEVHR